MHPELAHHLAELTDEAATLLADCGEKKWSEWLRTDAQRIRNLDLYGFKHLMSAFIGDDQIAPVNEDLSVLLSKISWLVKTLCVDEMVAQHQGKWHP